MADVEELELLKAQLAAYHEEVISLRNSLSRAHRVIKHLSTVNPDVYDQIISTLPPQDLQPASASNLSHPPAGLLTATPSASIAPNQQSLPSSTSRPAPAPAPAPGSPPPASSGGSVGSLTADDELQSEASSHSPRHTDASAGLLFLDAVGADKLEVRKKGREALASSAIDLSTYDRHRVDPKGVVAAAAKTGKVVDVVDVLARHGKLAGVARRGLKVLKEYSAGDEKVRREIAALGGIDIVCEAMRRFKDEDEGVSHYGVKCLGNLAFGNDDNRTTIGMVGIGLVVDVMKRWPDNADLQADAAASLTNIAHNSPVNARRIVLNQGPTVILDAMENHPSNIKVQRSSLWCLLTLSGDSSAAAAVADAGGVGAALAAMVNFDGDAGVQHFGIWAMLNVCFGGERICAFVAENGAPKIVQEAVINHPGHEGIVTKAGELLRKIDKYIVKQGL